MNPQAFDETSPAELVIHTDRALICLLIYNCISWVRKERKTGFKTLFWFRRKEVASIVEMWQSPQPINVDLRKWLASEQIFNAAVHDEI